MPYSSSVLTYKSTISPSHPSLACCSLEGASSPAPCALSSTSGFSWGSTTPGSTTHSDTRHIFHLVGGVSSADSPSVILPIPAEGLGVWDLSCTLSISQSTFASMSPTVGLGGSVFDGLQSTVSSWGDRVVRGSSRVAHGTG